MLVARSLFSQKLRFTVHKEHSSKSKRNTSSNVYSPTACTVPRQMFIVQQHVQCHTYNPISN